MLLHAVSTIAASRASITKISWFDILSNCLASVIKVIWTVSSKLIFSVILTLWLVWRQSFAQWCFDSHTLHHDITPLNARFILSKLLPIVLLHPLYFAPLYINFLNGFLLLSQFFVIIVSFISTTLFICSSILAVVNIMVRTFFSWFHTSFGGMLLKSIAFNIQ